VPATDGHARSVAQFGWIPGGLRSSPSPAMPIIPGMEMGVSTRDDRGGIVLGWLMRLTIILVLMGVLAFDVFSLAYTNVTTVDDAGIVAGSGAQTLMERPGDYDAARGVSVAQAQDLGVRMRTRDWWVDESGEVHVTVSRDAHTLALHYIPQLEKYLTVRAVGTAMSS
jgi:hypothetical protein